MIFFNGESKLTLIVGSFILSNRINYYDYPKNVLNHKYCI